jgi:uncharacterized protein (DUF433 family)
MAMNYQQNIMRDPAACGGEFVVRGTRVTVHTVLASLAEGMSVAGIVKDFPTLDEEAVRAVIAFAAASAEEDLHVAGLGEIPIHHVGAACIRAQVGSAGFRSRRHCR